MYPENEAQTNVDFYYKLLQHYLTQWVNLNKQQKEHRIENLQTIGGLANIEVNQMSLPQYLDYSINKTNKRLENITIPKTLITELRNLISDTMDIIQNFNS